MALGVGCTGFLLFSILFLPKILGRSNTLCPQTSFYHDCWIRRFSGFFLNLPMSEQRGAQVLQAETEPSAQLCSRKCCDQASCNMAVSYPDNSHGRVRCHLVHCPQPDSCILHQKDNAILFTITAGIDPDVLVFEKMAQIDLNPRSSLKWDRRNASGAIASPVPPHKSVLPSKEPLLHKASSAPFTTSVQPVSELHINTPHSLPHPPGLGDSSLRSYPPTNSPSFTAPYVSERTTDSLSGTSPAAEVALNGGRDSSWSPLGHPKPDLQSPAHLDSSKQHINETKGHSGKNQSSDAEVEDPSGPWVGLWLLPALVGSSVALLCCCSGILVLGCCRKRKRGRYKPSRLVDKRRGNLIRIALLKDKE